jgi:hypothetical protein
MVGGSGGNDFRAARPLPQAFVCTRSLLLCGTIARAWSLAAHAGEDAMATLGIGPDKVCYLITLARQFQAKVEPVEADPGSNMADDGFREILADYADDPVVIEMRQFLTDLNVEEYRNLLAVMWVGRGDYDVEEWDEVLTEAEAVRAERGPDYLIGTPLLSDHLEEGLEELGYSCEETDSGL